MWRNMMRTAPDPTARVASMYGMFTMLSALERTTRATRGMIGTVIAAMTFAILSSPVPSAATTAIAMTISGKLRRTSISRWTSYDVARGGEPDDDEQMPVRSGVVEEPRKRAGRVRDRRDERNAGGDIPLGVVQRTELQHPRGKAEM